MESPHPLWRKDPEIETMQTDFRRALARLVPVFMPELLFRLGPDGQPLFKEFTAAIVPTEFMPGKSFGTGTMQPIDYCVELAVRLVVEDGLPYRPASWHLWRDHRVFVPFATIQHWVEAGGKKGAGAHGHRLP